MNAIASQTRLTQLERDFSNFLRTHSGIVVLPNFEAHEYTTSELFDITQEEYFSKVHLFEVHLKSCRSSLTLDESIAPHNQSTADTVATSLNTFNNSLPKIEISKFNGALTEWARFRDLFGSLVHNRTDLTPVIEFTITVTNRHWWKAMLSLR